MPKQPDPWRSQIRTLQLRRRSLESQLLQPRPMIAASLLERFLPGGQSRRSSPAYYLSRWQQGRSKLTYVRKQELAAVRQQCQAYREFQQVLTARSDARTGGSVEASAGDGVELKHDWEFLFDLAGHWRMFVAI